MLKNHCKSGQIIVFFCALFLLFYCAPTSQFKSRVPFSQLLRPIQTQFWTQLQNQSNLNSEDQEALTHLGSQLNLPAASKALCSKNEEALGRLSTSSKNLWQNEALTISQALNLEANKKYFQAAKLWDSLIPSSNGPNNTSGNAEVTSPASNIWQGFITYHMVLSCSFEMLTPLAGATFFENSDWPDLEKIKLKSNSKVTLPEKWNQIKSLLRRSTISLKSKNSEEAKNLPQRCFDWGIEVYRRANYYSLSDAQKKYLYQTITLLHQGFAPESLELDNLTGIKGGSPEPEEPSTPEKTLSEAPLAEAQPNRNISATQTESGSSKQLSLMEALVKKNQLTSSLELMLVRKEKQNALLKESGEGQSIKDKLTQFEASLDLIAVSFPDLSTDYIDEKIKALNNLEQENKGLFERNKNLAKKFYQRISYYNYLNGDLKNYIETKNRLWKLNYAKKGPPPEEAVGVVAALILLDHTQQALTVICGPGNFASKKEASKCISQNANSPGLLYWFARLALLNKAYDLAGEATKLLFRNFPTDFYTISWLQQTSDGDLYEQWKKRAHHQFKKPQPAGPWLLETKQARLAEWIEELLINNQSELVKLYLPQFASENQLSFNKQASLRLWLVQLLYSSNFYGRGMYEISLLSNVTGLNVWDFVAGRETEYLKLLFPLPFHEWVQKESADFDPLFVQAIMRQESAFNKEALSSASAYGLMQLILATGKRMASLEKIKWEGPKTLLDPQNNIHLGVAYLRLLSSLFQNNGILVSAAYNAGEKALVDWLNALKPFLAEGMDQDLFIELIPFDETKKYVKSVFRNTFFHHLLYSAEPNLREAPTQDAAFPFTYARQKIFYQKAHLRELHSLVQ